ncbi:DUF397 domain-containing protein [Saccharopolyspora rectivirgula]|jgi:hypothetical protein|uniref:DUF397 domain-containing protein n=1 Tax=Saccharopolyspora rectivirgula TaxID=28042 RepID=UPI000687340C|nr:DUF397 domain-containing protein [Saccharopolyspora rectivirgula]
MGSGELAGWRKSSRSGAEGDCVEVSWGAGAVRVRDSKDPAGGALVFSPARWAEFLAGLRAGGRLAGGAPRERAG